MRCWKIIVFALLFLMMPNSAQGIFVKQERWFDTRAYFLDLVDAQSRRGETAKYMVKRTKANFGINGSYFGMRNTYHGISIFPIGQLQFRNDNITCCPAPSGRGFLWQAEIPGIGFHPPKVTIFCIEAGPILLVDDELVCSYQNFSRAHWNKFCLRSVVALAGNKVFLMKIYGNLWQISKYLKKRKIEYAICMDGGSSSADNVKVANAVVVFPKARPFYKKYKNKHFSTTSWSKSLSASE